MSADALTCRPEVVACLRFIGGLKTPEFAACWHQWRYEFGRQGDEPEPYPGFSAWRSYCVREGLIEFVPPDWDVTVTDLGQLVLILADEPNGDGNTVPTTVPTAAVDSPYLTLAEAAAYCRRSPQTLSNHKAIGRLVAVPKSRPPLFRVEDLDAWMTGRIPR